MLQFQDVSFTVRAGSEALEIIDHVSFTINRGDFVVITGPNGGGKSTIARLIMGIEQPTGGSILFDGQDITRMDIVQRAKLGIGYAFQQPPRFKGLTIRRLLSLASGREMAEAECCEYLSEVGLCAREYIDREFDNSLSGGEMKRVEIATLIARKLKLAIFDEPEAGIDLWSFSMLVETFKKICNGRHDSVIIISHQERIMRLADRIFIVDNGKLAQQGPAETMLPQIMEDLDSTSTCDCPVPGKEMQHG